MDKQESVPTITVAEWDERLRRQTTQSLFLRASLELTERCNLRCVHCYINRPAGDDCSRQRELSLTEWQSILNQVAEAGVLWLLVTGGEPLLRPDFAEFYRYAKRLGFHITLFTNGTLLTPDLADLFAKYPPWEVEITLYGATAETYERITGVPGSYSRCRQAIELLLERHVALNLKTMALTLNVDEIQAMQQLAGLWGVNFRYDPVIHSRFDGDHRPVSYRLTPEQIVALEREDPLRLQQWQDLCAKSYVRSNQAYLFTCGAGLSTFHIDPYGRLYPCLMARWLGYDLRTGSLAEAVCQFLPTVRNMLLTHDRTCWECDLRVICETCPAWARQETGDAEKPEPFRCHLAQLRKQELELTVQYAADSLAVGRAKE